MKELKLSTDKLNVQLIARICVQKGMRHAVISPGSRNAPLMVAFNREEEIRCHVVVDERSAAFYALGIAQQTGEAVALICTSGTALLNYAPAVAEAFYQRIPLMILSADRPQEWIDQDDSQTIRQFKVFAPYVKASYQLPVESSRQADEWYINRSVNEAFNLMMCDRKGPVHLNIPLDEPLFNQGEQIAENPRIFNKISDHRGISKQEMLALTSRIASCKKVMVLASLLNPSTQLEQALRKISKLPNVIILTETVSNLNDPAFISCIDRTICRIPKESKEDFNPELLISFGGAVISKFIKTRLKEFPPLEHWYVGKEEFAIDTFTSLTLQVDCNPALFAEQLAASVKGLSIQSDYAAKWLVLNKVADIRHEEYLNNTVWSDLKAFSLIIPAIPEKSRLQLSNGTTIRYHQLFKGCKASRVNCNRGTSGIDGSTSTAAGAASVFSGITTLITGDMSFLYDSNALWNNRLSPNLKIIVINNGGGGIFRFIKGPSELEELESYFETPHGLDISKLASLYRLDYFRAEDELTLEKSLGSFYETTNTAILEVVTPRFENDTILRKYFK
ncbi:MAG: 2-succinyl-5-enolpyruvyl-6-hydroxy-3-cyclohexene-1-carboxylic-acid synthase [Bacteroidales bacterium]